MPPLLSGAAGHLLPSPQDRPKLTRLGFFRAPECYLGRVRFLVFLLVHIPQRVLSIWEIGVMQLQITTCSCLMKTGSHPSLARMCKQEKLWLFLLIERKLQGAWTPGPEHTQVTGSPQEPSCRVGGKISSSLLRDPEGERVWSCLKDRAVICKLWRSENPSVIALDFREHRLSIVPYLPANTVPKVEGLLQRGEKPHLRQVIQSSQLRFLPLFRCMTRTNSKLQNEVENSFLPPGVL